MLFVRKDLIFSKKVILILGVILSMLFGLYPAPLFDEDEGFTAEVAREMLESGEYVLLESNFEPRYDKPPLAFWIISGSLYLFGNNEFAVRFPSLIFSLALLYLLFEFMRKRYGQERALVSTLFCTGTLQFAVMSKSAIADPYLYLFVVGGILALLNYSDSGKLKFLYLFTLCNALAFLTKGPVVLFISGVAVLTLCLYQKKTTMLLKVLNYRQIFLFMIVVLPWFVLSYQKVGMLLIDDFFFKHNLGRFSNSMEGHSGSYFYYLVVFVFGFLPFSFSHAAALYRAFRVKADEAETVFLVWFLAVFVLFTFSATKLPHYLMLGFFPLVMWSSGFVSNKGLRIAQWIALVFVLLLTIAPMAAETVAERTDDLYAQKLIAGFPDVFGTVYYLIQGICLAGIIFFAFLRRLSWAFILFFLVSVNTTLVAYSLLQQGPIKELAGLVDKEIVMKNHYSPSFSFYRKKPHRIRELKAGDYSIGKISDFRDYAYEVEYEKYGTVWVKILSKIR